MVRIPSNIQELVSYKPGKPVAEIVKELNLQEWAVLWNNENNLGPSPVVQKAIEQSLDRCHLYPDPTASVLCETIATLNDTDADHVTVDNGSESVFDCILRAFFEPRDELLTFEGTFVAVYIWAKSNNISCRKIPLMDDYQFDVDGLIQSTGPKTKAVYLANPNNPTGAMIGSSEMRRLIKELPKEVLIIVDEAYFEYAKALNEDYPDSFQLQAPNLITLRTLSKAYGIAGIRLGYALGEPRLIEAIRKVRMTFAPSNVAQAAGVGALQDPAHMEHAVDVNSTALQSIYPVLELAKLKYIESYGNFVMLDLGTEEKALQFVDDMLRAGIFIRHLRAFGLPHCVRISTGTEKENALLLQVLRLRHH